MARIDDLEIAYRNRKVNELNLLFGLNGFWQLCGFHVIRYLKKFDQIQIEFRIGIDDPGKPYEIEYFKNGKYVGVYLVDKFSLPETLKYIHENEL